MSLRITLFDHLRTRNASGELPASPRPRAQRLLAYLLLHRDRPLPREHIATALWPDGPEQQAFGALRRALSDLRSALPSTGDEAWFIVTDSTLQWNPDAPYWLDIAEFELALRQGTAAELHQAIELYTGDLLVRWDDEWLIAERERLRRLQVGALRRLAEHHRALGNETAALELTQQALILDPLSEAVYRDLISLLYLSGDRAAALNAFEDLSCMLDSELGVEPMAETQALRAAIVQGGPLPVELASNGAVATATTAQRALPTLVGRDPEQRVLAELWDRAVAGRGGLVVVSGDAGIGKSRLALGRAEEVTAGGGLALVGHCYEFEQALPYQAPVEMLRAASQLVRHSDLAPAHRSTLTRIAPDMLDVAVEPSTDEVTAELRMQLFEALLQAFLALARAQPLLLVIEDVHWAANSTLDWITYVAPRLDHSSVLVVITHRTDEIGSERPLAGLHRRLARATAVTRLPLTPLSAMEHRDLVRELSGLPAEEAEPLADRLFAETAGNPFFLREIVRALTETGQLETDNGRWTGPFIHAPLQNAVPLPDSVRDLLSARVERLQPASQTFIQAAAVAGRVFEYDLVQHVTGWTEEQALLALEDVMARGFIDQFECPDEFAFSHHLIQEVVYAQMTTPRRRFWHQRFAEAFQALRSGDVEALAHHFSRAGDDERARGYYVQSAERARRLAALGDAARLYRAALDRWPADDPAGRAALLYERGQCLWILGELHAALGSLEEARDLFISLGERLRVGDTERLIGRVYWEQSNRQAALEHYHRALAILEQEPASIELARAVSAISQMHMLAAESNQAIAWGERALALAEQQGAEDVAIHAQTNIGLSLVGPEDVERGLEMLRDSLRRALAANFVHEVMRIYIGLGEQLLSLGRYGEAQATYEALLEYAGRVRSDLFTGIALKSLLQLEWLTGHWAEALAHRRELLDWMRDSSRPPLATVWANRMLGTVHNDLGQAELACQVLERDLATARNAAELQTTTPHLAELARAHAGLGREADAAALFRELLAFVDADAQLVFDCIMPLLIACRWFATRNDPAEIDALRAGVALLGRAADQVGAAESQAALAEGTGLLRLTSGDASQAIEQLGLAVTGWQALDRAFDQAYALATLARALQQAGQTPAARATFDQALATFAALADRLPEPELRAAFLNSPHVREVRVTRLRLDGHA